MKLAFISTMAGGPWGGSETLWYETAKLALEQGHSVLTSTFLWEQLPASIGHLKELGAQTYFRPRYNASTTVRLYRRLKKLLQPTSPEINTLNAFAPDQVIVNQGGGYDLLHRADLQAYLLHTSIPYLIVCHNYNEDLVLSETERDVLLRIYQKARAVFMICQPQVDTIMKQLGHRLTNIKLTDNPINLKVIKPLSYPSLQPVKFASVASFDVDRKGQDILFEALSTTAWKSRNWILNLYGAGRHRQYIELLIRYFDLVDRVHLKGHVDDISTVWKEHHLLLLSSRIETGPMALTEAMFCGRPAVATPVGRVPDLVKDGINGFVSEGISTHLFGNALERAWQRQEDWSALGLAAYRSALDSIDQKAASSFLQFILQ